MDLLVAASHLLEEGVLVEEFLRGVLVLAVACVDEGGPRPSRGVGVAAQGVLEPAAHALELGADDVAGLVRIAVEHLDRVGHRFVLVERRGGRIEKVRARPEKFRCVVEGLAGARGVLHEDEVDRVVVVVQPELARLASGLDRPLELARLAIEIALLVEGKVVDDRDRAPLEGTVPGTHVSSNIKEDSPQRHGAHTESAEKK